MKISTKQVFGLLYIVSWIIFAGVCVEAGGFIFNAIFTLVLNPESAKHLWKEVDLTSLYQYDKGYYFVEMFVISLVAVMRACLFYLIIKILHDKKLSLSQPFNREMCRFIFRVSYLAFLIGSFSWGGVEYAEWFVSKGVKMPGIQYLRLAGADVWLFMSITLGVIAQIFKRGVEIQTESELTV